MATDIGKNIIKHKDKYCVDTHLINKHGLSDGDQVKFKYKNNNYIGVLTNDGCLDKIIMLKENKNMKKTAKQILTEAEEQKEVTAYLEKEKEPKDKVWNELIVGGQVESEHQPTFEWLKKYYEDNKAWPDAQLFYNRISRDHIKQDKGYYMKMNKAGLIDEKIVIKN